MSIFHHKMPSVILRSGVHMLCGRFSLVSLMRQNKAHCRCCIAAILPQFLVTASCCKCFLIKTCSTQRTSAVSICLNTSRCFWSLNACARKWCSLSQFSRFLKTVKLLQSTKWSLLRIIKKTKNIDFVSGRMSSSIDYWRSQTSISKQVDLFAGERQGKGKGSGFAWGDGKSKTCFG